MADANEFTSQTVAAIYSAYEDAEKKKPRRRHLGASEIGHECERWLWYSWRWAVREEFGGRMLRLFSTGHLAEPRFVDDLRAIGCEVSEGPAPGKQWREIACGGHFGSAIDSAALGVPEAPKRWHLVEFKTHSSKSFAKLAAQGVAKSKPRHYAQMIVGMELHGLSRALYLAVNKDTDELYSERLREDPIEAQRLLAKADRIINAHTPPPRLSDNPAWWQCKFCPAHSLCHGNAWAERNCKTCLHSTPVADGKWACALHGECEPSLAGCPDHLYLPSLVPGEQVDAGETWVSYKLRDGKEWLDGARDWPTPAERKQQWIDDSNHHTAIAEACAGVLPQWSEMHALCKCGYDTCHACRGGWSFCTTCGGAESSLPTHCPGFRMNAAQLDAISEGRDNFANGVWLGAPF